MRTLRTAAAALGILATATGAHAQVVYANDFNGGSTANLSADGGGVAVHTPFAGCSSATYCSNFLGRANGEPFANHTLTLSLASLPAHSDATVSFALFILSSWDGNGASGFGPDLFTVTAAGSTLLNTTFGIALGPQNYPDPAGGGTHPVRTGAVENDGLGNLAFGSSVYLFSYTFAHVAPSLTVTWAGSGLQGWSDPEGWGIDDLRVTLTPTASVTPEPGTWALLATGLAAVGGVARRGRRRRA